MTDRRLGRTFFGVRVPYDTRVIKRVDAFFQPTNYVRSVSLAIICLALVMTLPDRFILLMFLLRIAGIAGQAALVGRLPPQIGLRGLTLVAVSTLLVGLPYIAGTLYLWAQPEPVFRYIGVFALGLSMIDTVCARRGDLVLFVCDNVLIAVGCLLFPVVSWWTGQPLLEVALIGLVSVTGFGFYLYGAADVMRARAALDAAHDRETERAKTEALGRLTGGVAHDFNNLLTVISGNLELLQHNRDPRESAELLNDAATAAARAAQVTGQLLAYSRRAPLEPVAVDLAASLSELEMLMKRLLPAGIALNARADPGLPSLVVDRGRFDAVLLNLAINARDALRGNGVIAIRAMRERIVGPVYVNSSAVALPAGDYVRIEVEDNGSGMTAEVMSRVFEPYFTTKPKGQGAGMGLAMARGFAEQSGGVLTLTSAVGVGSIATLILPACTGRGVPV